MVSSSYKKGFPHAWGREASIKSVLLNCNHGQKRLNWPKLKKGGGFDTACKKSDSPVTEFLKCDFRG